MNASGLVPDRPGGKCQGTFAQVRRASHIHEALLLHCVHQSSPRAEFHCNILSQPLVFQFLAQTELRLLADS